MAYSRFSNSNWYSFYSSSSGEEKKNQILSLWYAGERSLVEISYNELIEIKSPKELQIYYESEIPFEDLVEAMEYIHWFIQDVNEEFDCDKK